MRRNLAILTFILLTVPTVAASWKSQGQTEPNTAYDLAGGRVWTTPPVAGEERVYFNAFETTSSPGVSPNLAATGTRIEAAPVVRFQALLGLWNDCNGDGYIGLGETGATEYRAELLPLGSSCAAGTTHNDGNVIREIVHIAAVDPCALESQAVRDAQCGGIVGYQPRAGIVLAQQTRVWGDRGVPGASGYEGCNILPVARGTDARTGKMIRYADCAMQHGIIGPIDNVVDPDCSLHLCMDPDHPDQSDSILNRDMPVNLFGSPYTGQHGLLERGWDAPTIDVWDCQGSGNANPTVAADPTQASVWDATTGAAAKCDPATQATLDGVYPFGVVEAPVGAPAHEQKVENDLVFRFDDGATAPKANPEFVLLPFHDPGAGPEPRLSVVPPAPVVTRFPAWVADQQYLSAGQSVNRNDLSASGPSSWTFYARVDPTQAQLHGWTFPIPEPATYGTDACADGIGPGIAPQNHWGCDPATWWTDGSVDTHPTYARGEKLGAAPGDVYDLRDVDCDDGTIEKCA